MIDYGTTISVNSVVWIRETSDLRRSIGIYGQFEGEFGTGRFGIKTMSNEELAVNFYALKDNEIREPVTEEGAKWYEIWGELLSEIEVRYFKQFGFPDHFIKIIKEQGGIDWHSEEYSEQEIFTEMMEEVLRNAGD